MEGKFEVRLCNSLLAFLIGVPSIVAALFSLMGILFTTPIPIWAKLLLSAGWAASVYGVYILLRRIVIKEAVVAVEPKKVVVNYVHSGQEQLISFDDVAVYKYQSFRDQEDLIFKMKQGGTRKISTNGLFGPVGDFGGLVQAVEQAAASYRQQNPQAMVRGKSFFEKPVSTVLLVIMTILICLLVGMLVTDDRPVKGNLFAAFGGYVSYLAAWLAASSRRSQPSE